MSADLHIHVFECITEDDIAKLNVSTVGSKHFDLVQAMHVQRSGIYMKVINRIHSTPNVWIGEVSWLKASVFGDVETFVPNPIAGVQEIIGEDLPVIDGDLIERIGTALSMTNTTKYHIVDRDKVLTFLRKHMGKQVFTVSW